MSTDPLLVLGRDPETGESLAPPLTLDAVYERLRAAHAAADPGLSRDPNHLLGLTERLRDARAEHAGVADGVMPDVLASAGWGVVFPWRDPGDASDEGRRRAGVEQAWLEALGPLLRCREGAAGGRYKVFDGDKGPKPDEGVRDWLGRHRARADQLVDPRRVPYYLLLVASPEEIPFEFQYLLDVEYAVGRVCFEQLDAARRWASAVARTEGAVSGPRRADLFGTRYDGATELAWRGLLSAAHRQLGPEGRADRLDADRLAAVSVQLCPGQRREDLVGLLRAPPDLLMTATHGLGYARPVDEESLRRWTGSLICDKGLVWGGTGPEHYFGPEAIDDSMDLGGMVAILFACFSAGCPRRTDFPSAVGMPSVDIGPVAVTSRLAERLLAAGAGAVLGHVERAWSTSIGPNGETAALLIDLAARLLAGDRVGWATELLGRRLANLTVDLAMALDWTHNGAAPRLNGRPLSPIELTRMWITAWDARNFIVLGDPAARARATRP